MPSIDIDGSFIGREDSWIMVVTVSLRPKEDSWLHGIWGYQRLSPKMKEVCQKLSYSHDVLDAILAEVVSTSLES